MPGAGSGRTGKLIYLLTAVLSIGFALALMAWPFFSGSEADSSLVLIAGGCMLPAGWALLNLFLIRTAGKTGRTIPGFLQLTLKNLSMRRTRTISAVALLSLGTFTVIITGANRKAFYGDETARNSGTGGFLLWTETTFPVMNDLNSILGARIFGLRDETVLKEAKFIQLPGLNGDDASCLNLNQVSRPGMIGVPANLFDQLKAFSFSKLHPSVDKIHPWKALSFSLAPGVIPGFADQTVITWGLRKSVGDTLLYRDESGRILKIKLVGGLENSIFQGNILVSDSLLRLFYPSAGGSRIMLVDGKAAQRDTVAQRLEFLFRDYGLMATPASQRLASFNAVENTYLSVFMLLGGLGVIIGTVGLGIILLRNIAQRRQELALYVALGFRKQFVFRMILAEHVFILVSGLLLGIISALPGIFPILIFHAKTVPWQFISGILVLILANGFLWIYFPAKKIMGRDPLDGLRAE
jgi:ABC-type antimicrobial peptide transport system permease subunit